MEKYILKMGGENWRARISADHKEMLRVLGLKSEEELKLATEKVYFVVLYRKCLAGEGDWTTLELSMIGGINDENFEKLATGNVINSEPWRDF